MSNEKPLTKQQKKFLDEFFLNGEDVLAAHKVAYPRCSQASAATEAYQKLKKLRSSSYFQVLEAEKLRKDEEFKKKVEEKFEINREWLLEQNKRVFTEAMAGDAILTESGKQYTKYDRHAALKALDQLTKIIGEYADTRQKLQIEGSGPNGEIEIAHVKLD